MTRTINEIILHCTATPRGWMGKNTLGEQVAEIRRWHVQERGWRDIGYHWIIGRDGSIAKGRDESQQGAHCKGHNAQSLGVALVGGHGSRKDDLFTLHYTPEQDAALRRLIGDIRARLGAQIPIHGHHRYAAKACPGFDVPRWWAGKPPAPPRQSPAQSTTLQASATQIAAAAGTGATALAAFEGTAQLLAIGLAGAIALLALWIMRERLKRWAAGDR